MTKYKIRIEIEECGPDPKDLPFWNCVYNHQFESGVVKLDKLVASIIKATHAEMVEGQQEDNEAIKKYLRTNPGEDK